MAVSPAVGVADGFVIVEQIQNSLDITFNAAEATIPLISGNIGNKRRDLKIIFDVYGQRIHD